MAVEFDCAECGAHVVQIVAEEMPKVALCCQCIALPGWFNDPTLVRMLDPGRQLPGVPITLKPAPANPGPVTINGKTLVGPDGPVEPGDLVAGEPFSVPLDSLYSDRAVPVNWSNNPMPVTPKEIFSGAWDAMLGAMYPRDVAALGLEYGFRRAYWWETPKAYRQSLVCYLVRKALGQ